MYEKMLSEVVREARDFGQGDLPVFLEDRAPTKSMVVLICSDRGLCGAFNNNIFKAFRRWVETEYPSGNPGEALKLLPLGKRAFDYCRKQPYEHVSEYHEIFSDLGKAHRIFTFLSQSFRHGELDRVVLIYNRFLSVGTQEVQLRPWLPYVFSKEDAGSSTQGGEPIFEPDRVGAFSKTLEYLLEASLYRVLWDSNASEHGARLTAMEQATENGEKLIKELRIEYNRSRQAAVTKEILEIVGGAEALESQ